MAYISTETVKEIKSNIKRVFPTKEGYKFSITKRDSMEVCVSVLSAPINFDLEGRSYKSINHYWIDSNYEGKQLRFLKQLKSLIEGNAGTQYDRNAGDMGADYPDCNYYIDISLGKWNKPFTCTL